MADSTSDKKELPSFQAKFLEALARDFALRFKVSVPTVMRWMDGRNSPHEFMQQGIFDWFTQQSRKYEE